MTFELPELPYAKNALEPYIFRKDNGVSLRETP